MPWKSGISSTMRKGVSSSEAAGVGCCPAGASSAEAVFGCFRLSMAVVVISTAPYFPRSPYLAVASSGLSSWIDSTEFVVNPGSKELSLPSMM